MKKGDWVKVIESPDKRTIFRDSIREISKVYSEMGYDYLQLVGDGGRIYFQWRFQKVDKLIEDV